MRWALPLLVIASMANAQALSTSIRSGGLSPERFPSAAQDSALLRFLPSVSASQECTGSALTGTKGQALTFTRASSAYCTKSDGTMVLLTNNPTKRAGLEGYGLEIVGRQSLPTLATPENLRYLKTKRDRMGHDLPGLAAFEDEATEASADVVGNDPVDPA